VLLSVHPKQNARDAADTQRRADRRRRPFAARQQGRELPAYRCVTFVKEPVERTQYLPRDCSMDLVNSREKSFLIAGPAALRRCSRRRGFSPDVLLLGGGFHQRSPKL